MLVITAATELELSCLLERMPAQQRRHEAGMRLYSGSIRGQNCLVAQTGVGLKKASAAARHLAAHCAPTAVLTVGAAGALNPALNIGDIIVIERVSQPGGACLLTDAVRSRSVKDRLAAAGLRCLTGSCVTTGDFMHAARDKQALFNRSGAEVLDMESAGLARWFCAAGVPFLDVRIVSDTAREDAFNVSSYYAYRKTAAGRRAYGYFLNNPGEIPRALRLRKNMRLVAKTVADVLACVMPL